MFTYTYEFEVKDPKKQFSVLSQSEGNTIPQESL